MGRIFTVELEREKGDDYLVCRACKTQIALRQDSKFSIPGEDGVVFDKVVNVVIDEPIHHYQVGPHTVADIYCVTCGYDLGLKYIKVCGVHIYPRGGYNYTLENNMVKLKLDKLLWIDGESTTAPVLDNIAPALDN